MKPSLRMLNFRRKLMRLRKIWESFRDSSDKVYFHHRVDQYRGIWRAVAKANNATLVELDSDLWEIRKGASSFRVLNHQLELDNPVTLNLAGRKPLMHRLLSEHDLHVPEHTTFRLDSIERAYSFLKEHQSGCVIKPSDGSAAGDGVTTHIRTEKDVQSASVLASLYCPDLLMEPQIPGECYRLLVIGGKMVHAACRRGPRLKGDGISSVSKLIEEENFALFSRNEQAITIDSDCRFTLEWQELSLDSVPDNGREFIVKTVHDPRNKLVEIRTVYNTNVTSVICSSIRETVEKAARILKSDFVGIDLICTDPTLPLGETGGIINEVNTTPALHHHYDSQREAYPQPAQAAYDLLMSRANQENRLNG